MAYPKQTDARAGIHGDAAAEAVWDPAHHQPARDGRRRTMRGKPVHACGRALDYDQYDPAARHLPHPTGDGWCPGYSAGTHACPTAPLDRNGGRNGHGGHAHDVRGLIAWCCGYRPGFHVTFDPPHNHDDPTGIEADRAAGMHYTAYFQAQMRGVA